MDVSEKLRRLKCALDIKGVTRKGAGNTFPSTIRKYFSIKITEVQISRIQSGAAKDKDLLEACNNAIDRFLREHPQLEIDLSSADYESGQTSKLPPGAPMIYTAVPSNCQGMWLGIHFVTTMDKRNNETQIQGNLFRTFLLSFGNGNKNKRNFTAYGAHTKFVGNVKYSHQKLYFLGDESIYRNEALCMILHEASPNDHALECRGITLGVARGNSADGHIYASKVYLTQLERAYQTSEFERKIDTDVEYKAKWCGRFALDLEDLRQKTEAPELMFRKIDRFRYLATSRDTPDNLGDRLFIS